MKKTVKQLEKKAKKKEKKIRSEVIKVFGDRNKKEQKELQRINKKENKTNNQLVENITKSVILNKRMLGRDNYQLKRWQESYFQELYSEFRRLVEKYNKGLQVKAETLADKISDLKTEKKMLQCDVKELEERKKVLIND
jgi:archaellum component FlaC